MWSDNETLADCIEYNHLISAVTGIIDDPNRLTAALEYLVPGEVGKSSLMRMIEEKYKGRENTLVIRFNVWLFEGYEIPKLS